MALWLWWVIVAPGVTVGMRGACTMRSEGELVYEEVCGMQCVWLKHDSGLTDSDVRGGASVLQHSLSLVAAATACPCPGRCRRSTSGGPK